MMIWGLSKLTTVTQITKTDEETKEYHRKRLYELSLKSIGENTELEELTDEQKQFIKGKRFHK